MNILLSVFIIIPVLAGVVLYMLPLRLSVLKTVLFICALAVNCFYSIFFYGKEIIFDSRILFNLDLLFRYYNFSSLMILILGMFALLTAIYAVSFMTQNKRTFTFYAFMLLALAFTNGVLLADNFVILILFWEAIMIPLFAMIALGKKDSSDTALKAFVISAVADLCLMFGIILICAFSGTFLVSQISIDINRSGAVLAFVLMFIGAAAKAGAMPFHSWIPDAADKAPVPFMVFMVTVVEKILAVYILIRIVKDFFVIEIGSPLSIYAMIFGAVTLLCANMLAVFQKDFKKMLSYASIAQAGYMIVAISTVTVFGMVAALFHMTAHIIYKSSLFFTAGSIEQAEGTTNMDDIKDNLRKSMPYTFISFILAGAAFAGVPLFLAAFSKEMIYESAMSVSWLFYLCLVIGSLLSAVAIINWARILFFNKKTSSIIVSDKEVSNFMFIPMIITALSCLLLGIFHKVPQNAIIKIIGQDSGGHSELIAVFLVVVSILVLIFAYINNVYLGKKDDSHGLGILSRALKSLKIDKLDKNNNLDPYNIFMSVSKKFANLMLAADKGLNYLYDVTIPFSVEFVSSAVKKAHNGNISFYLLWVILGIIFIFIIF